MFKKQKDHIEFTDTGFLQHKHKKLWRKKHIEVHWEDVNEISVFMWDCVSYHAFGFRLTLGDGSCVCIDEDDPSWTTFRESLVEHFPTIDQLVIIEVEGLFPSESELCCWTKLAEQDAAPNRLHG